MDTASAGLGTNGAQPPLLPVATSDTSIIFEWAALLPLAVYLASSRFSHQLVGGTALTRTICVGLFPRLGVLSSIADFLENGPDFLDRASSVSELRRTVWDVKWGSVFPCANGAASAILSSCVLRRVKLEQMPGNVVEVQKQNPETPPSRSTAPQIGKQTPPVDAKSNPPQPQFRRYQTLHILQCDDLHPGVRSTLVSPKVMTWRNICRLLVLLGLLSVCVVTIMFGLYGTATAILITIVFRLCKLLIHVKRPSGYLHSNEGESGCMLVALHENASTWYLYRGSRAVIDTLLNKTMIESIESPFGIWLSYTLRCMEILQLISMTYVASQKGWDGIALLSLIVVAWAYDYIAYNNNSVAEAWIRRERVDIQARSYSFGGRTAMIGVIQKLSGTEVTSWMDGILAQSDRRDVWLSQLAGHPDGEGSQRLNEGDLAWVDLNTRLTNQALEVIQGSSGETA